MMLAAAATSHRVFRGAMPSDSRSTPPRDQALAIGEALRSLRERVEMTQEAAGEALGVTRQAWQQYETSGKVVLLRTDMQERLASALGLSRDDLMRERDRLAGMPTHPAPRPEGGAKIYELPVLGRVRAGPLGPQIYELSEPESYFDASWMFGPNARTLRVAGDTMQGYVESGQLVIYDLSVWPRHGDGCVVELRNGEVYVKEYDQVSQGVLKVRQRFPEDTLTFPMAEVKGVYLIRFRGS